MVKSILFLLSVTIFLLEGMPADAQKLVIGEKIPEIKIGEWLTPKIKSGDPMYLEFFHPASNACLKRINRLDSMAIKFKDRMSVLLLVRDDTNNTRSIFVGESFHFHAAIDDNGKTYSSFGIHYVPFGVLINGKGRVVWFGNPVSLTDTEIERRM